jgi:hypothetical protein
MIWVICLEEPSISPMAAVASRMIRPLRSASPRAEPTTWLARVAPSDER